MMGFLRVLFTPGCWLNTGRYSAKWDKLLRHLMNHHKFEGRKERTVTLGPVEIWIANHPYCSFQPYKYENGVMRGPVPRRITRLRAMDRLDQDTWFNPAEKQND